MKDGTADWLDLLELELVDGVEFAMVISVMANDFDFLSGIDISGCMPMELMPRSSES